MRDALIGLGLFLLAIAAAGFGPGRAVGRARPARRPARDDAQPPVP